MEKWTLISVVIVIGVNTVCLHTKFISVHSTGRLPCKHNVSSREFHRVKWFRSNAMAKSNRALVLWDNTSQPNTTNNYGIDKHFSLVIYNVSIPDKGLYRCHITLNVPPFSRTYYAKLNVYALPSTAPLIQRVNDIFIICSVDRVYPLLYPQVEFEHEEYAVENTDGTYNTSVSGSIQDIPRKAVTCSFPHFNYSETSSLSLYPTTTPYGNDDEPPTSGALSPESSIHRGKSFTGMLWPILAAAAAAILAL